MRVKLSVAKDMALALAWMTLSLVAACSRVHHPTGMLVRGGGADPDSLDPQRARSVEAQTILRDLCEGLTTLDRSAAAAPGVASEWSMSPDGKTYTFKLRPDARWSTGDPLVAGVFVVVF